MILWASCQSTSESTKTSLHPKTDSFLNSNSTLCLPSMFIHFTTHCDSVIPAGIVAPRCLWVCVHPPTFVETVPVSQGQPWGHHPSSLWPPQGKEPLSPCRKGSIHSLPLSYDRHGAYLQKPSRFNKATSKYARCQLFVYRESNAIWRHL